MEVDDSIEALLQSELVGDDIFLDEMVMGSDEEEEERGEESGEELGEDSKCIMDLWVCGRYGGRGKCDMYNLSDDRFAGDG